MPPRSTSRSPTTNVAAFLGERLSQVRLAAKYQSQEALAESLRTDRTTITKIETGERPPNGNLLQAWLTACGVNGLHRETLEGLGVLARAREDPGAQAAPWFETEAKAHTLRYWAPLIVPGLVQTEAYARELFTAQGFEEADVAELVEARMNRQAILDRSPAPDVTIVLWEPVLDHQIGTRTVMHEQLNRLVEVSQRRMVAIHVLPSSLGANPGLGGAINLAATDDAPELLLSDGLVEDQLTQEPPKVHQARGTFGTVRADALNRADSRTALRKAMERWST
jgi:transcriptional regulator with XRE-family HTH domain